MQPTRKHLILGAVGAGLALTAVVPTASAQSYAPPQGATPGSFAPPADSFAPRPAPPDATTSPPPAGRSLDPLLPTGITTAAVGSIFLVFGATELDRASGETSSACGLSGCVEVDFSYSETPVGEMLLTGGGIMAAGGAGMLVYALAEPPRRATAGRARIAAGAMGLSLGAGTAVMGAMEATSDVPGGAGAGILVSGIITSAISAPILVWGAQTIDEGNADDVYDSEGRIVAGSILTATGIGFGTLTAATLGASTACNGSFCAFGYIFSLVPLGGAAACLGTGIPLFAGGASTAPARAMPEVAVGAGDVQLSWRFQ
jgi:hypothetical protein